MADVTSTDDDEFEDHVSQAEELIDAYVGPQEMHIHRVYHGKAESATSTTLVDASDDSNLDDHDNGFFAYCEVEIIGGTGSGQQRFITASSKSGASITVAPAWSTTPDSTSIYQIFQLGKFPRRQDVYHEPDSLTYHKSIPEAIKRAVAAQVQFIIEMGDDYFSGDTADKDSESIGNYSYSRGTGGAGSSVSRLIGPKAKSLLRGYKNLKGKLIV